MLNYPHGFGSSWLSDHKIFLTQRKLCCNLFCLSHLCCRLHPSDNIPNDALPGNESQYGIQSISEPHGSRHRLDAGAAAQYSPAGPWESHRPGSHGQRHLRTKTCAHRQAWGMQPARSCCVAMFGSNMMKSKCWSVLPLTLPGLSRIPAW